MNLSSILHGARRIEALQFPLRFVPRNMKMFILRGRLRGKRWIVGSGNHECWLGTYEYQKQILFEKTVTEGSIVFDVGAHVGFYTLLASVLVGSKGRVFAFEPSPRNLIYLRQHLQLNRVTNVEIIEAAISNSSGTVLFDEGHNGYTGRISPEGSLEVRSVSLDELVMQGHISIPSYMKIDVEGAEMSVLLGAKSILAEASPTLFLSTHDHNVHQQCCEFIGSLGYHLESISGASVKKSSEILAYSERMTGEETPERKLPNYE